MSSPVKIIRRAGAKRFIGRRLADGTIQITVPAGLSYGDAAEIIDRLIRRIEESAPATAAGSKGMFHDGMVIENDLIRFRISTKGASRGRISALRSSKDWIITVGEGWEFGLPATDAGISRVMIRVAVAISPALIIPEAQAIARKIGKEPRCWKTGRGLRTLGTCHADGSITLSAALMFLPPELREYVVCHELAHLTEMNHSADFHRLCDSYCGGREHSLATALKHFRWPILRV